MLVSCVSASCSWFAAQLECQDRVMTGVQVPPNSTSRSETLTKLQLCSATRALPKSLKVCNSNGVKEKRWQAQGPDPQDGMNPENTSYFCPEGLTDPGSGRREVRAQAARD